MEYDSVNVDETSQAGVVESVYDCNGSEKEGTDFADVGTLYDEVVVTNEDVINGTDYDVYEDFNISQV